MESAKLSKKQLIELCSSPYTSDKAQIITSVLKDMIIIKDNLIYKLELYFNTYTTSKYSENKILPMITKLIEKSYKLLNNNDKQEITENCPYYKKFFTNQFVKDFLPQIKNSFDEFTNTNKYIFDTYTNEIHYLNGYYDLKNNKFCNRKIGKHYVTKYIDRDYSKSTKKDQKFMNSILRQIIPNKDDMMTILMTFGSALSGKSIVDQDLLMIIGEGSSGKSVLMELICLVVQSEVYFKELKDDTFANPVNLDKILNSYVSNPQLRYSWLNEPSNKRCNASTIKEFCDAKLQTTKLYKEGSHTLHHYSKPIITMNNYIDVLMDSGVERRLKCYSSLSKFVDNKEDVDETKNIYLKDKYLLKNIENNKGLLNAFFDILAQYCYEWNNGAKIVYSKNFLETKKTITSVNDHIQDFIDSNLEQTKNENDRIGKQEMLELFLSTNKNKFLTIAQLITSLKSKGIFYNCDYRSNGKKGCFYSVKYKDENNDKDDPTENGIQQVDQSINQKLTLQEQIKLHEDKLKELNDLFLKECESKVIIKKVKKITKIDKVVVNAKKEKSILDKVDKLFELEF